MNTDTHIIFYKNLYWIPQFYHQKNEITLKDVTNLLKSDKEADTLLTEAKTMLT